MRENGIQYVNSVHRYLENKSMIVSVQSSWLDGRRFSFLFFYL